MSKCTKKNIARQEVYIKMLWWHDSAKQRVYVKLSGISFDSILPNKVKKHLLSTVNIVHVYVVCIKSIRKANNKENGMFRVWTCLVCFNLKLL